MTSIVDCERIKKETLVADVEVFATLPSTNDHALKRAADRDCQKPLLIFAEQQTAGRGRGTNRWWSDGGALTFSLLTESIPTASSSSISLAMGVAACDAIRGLGGDLDAGLKWPNDVYLAGRKVGGILIERLSYHSGDLVVGVGLNVNNSLHCAPAEISETATSLVDVARRLHNLQLVLIRLLQHIEKAFAALRSDQRWLQHRWRELCILSGRRVVVDIAHRRHAGLCQGIDDDGALIVQTASGPVKCVNGVVKAFQ